MPAPDGASPGFSKISLANGDAAVLRLEAVAAGDIAALSETEHKQLRQQIQQLRGRLDYNAMLAALKEGADIRIGDSDLGTITQ
jgi:hypothetical protein